MISFFRVDHIFFTLFGYPMSYVEFIGTVLNILSVWLVARKNIWNWPVGNVAVVLFGILFYQIRLYSDLFEQIYFLITGFYGWWVWARTKRLGGNSLNDDIGVQIGSSREYIIIASIIVAGTAGMGTLMSKVHIFLPKFFPETASYPYIDAWTTIMSFVAQWLMVKKKIESWYLWILVDVIGIWLYYEKHIVFVSILYMIFLVLAIRGLNHWRKELSKNDPASSPSSV